MHSSSTAPALPQAAQAQALWNPSVAACWSLVFTPAFGAWLLMRNWEALGEPGQARAARKWFVFGIGLLVVRVLSAAINARLNSQSNLLHWVSLGYLLAWWLAAAAPQARLVRSRLGPDYPRQGWDYALFLAVLLGSAYQLASAFFTWLFVALT
jgi:hypothetical protein